MRHLSRPDGCGGVHASGERPGVSHRHNETKGGYTLIGLAPEPWWSDSSKTAQFPLVDQCKYKQQQ